MTRGGVLALVALLGACAAPTAPRVEVSPPKQSLFLLLPDEGGTVGSIVVSNPAGTQVLTQSGQAVHVAGAGGAPSAPFMTDSAEVTRVFGDTLAAQPPPPARFVLYFQGDSDQLTRESQRLLTDVVRSIAERHPSDVSVVGHTDTVGARDYNYRLGVRRAERVRAELHGLGAQWSTLSLESHGKGNLLVPTADGVAEPRNRRVEIIVR